MDKTPIIIIGAGPVGLTTSILLSRLGIPSILVEKRANVSTLPRSRGITQRTVEIWSQFGLYDELTEMSLPSAWCRKFVSLMHRLKRSLDPAGILNPGKVFTL